MALVLVFNLWHTSPIACGAEPSCADAAVREEVL
jgi:hypothetical protein